MKTNIYVDGFNLYYGALKSTPYKWLNIVELCHQLLPKSQIHRIKYFTAHVNARPNDPDQHIVCVSCSTRRNPFRSIFSSMLANERFCLAVFSTACCKVAGVSSSG